MEDPDEHRRTGSTGARAVLRDFVANDRLKFRKKRNEDVYKSEFDLLYAPGFDAPIEFQRKLGCELELGLAGSRLYSRVTTPDIIPAGSPEECYAKICRSLCGFAMVINQESVCGCLTIAGDPLRCHATVSTETFGLKIVPGIECPGTIPIMISDAEALLSEFYPGIRSIIKDNASIGSAYRLCTLTISLD